MPKVVKHAWTHRPRAQGGTDPIEIPAGGPVSAYARGPATSTTLTNYDVIPFDELWATPGGYFTPIGGNPASFSYIGLEQDGWYQADFMVFWSTDFAGSTFPYIEPQAHVAGSDPNVLIPTLNIPYWDTTQSWIGGEQFTTAELDHHQLVARVLFNYTAADIDPVFGIGVAIRSSSVATKTIGGGIAVTWLGDALTQVT